VREPEGRRDLVIPRITSCARSHVWSRPFVSPRLLQASLRVAACDSSGYPGHVAASYVPRHSASRKIGQRSRTRARRRLLSRWRIIRPERPPVMHIIYLPVLGTLRELYRLPRDMRRFQRYVATMTGGTDDIVLPIGVANPMAREHAVAKLDELLALGAEETGAAAAEEAEAQMGGLAGEMTASLVLADDVAGGWTNRYTTEASVRFPGRGALKRPFATGLLWTSESPSADEIRRELLGAIYRLAYQRRHGLPMTLRAMLTQEGLAGAFAGDQPALGADELARARAIIAPYLDTESYPEAFACLYGDVAAEELGYRSFGLPHRAGFTVALTDALADHRDPLAALRA